MPTPRELAREKTEGASADRRAVNQKYTTSDLAELFRRSKALREGADVNVIVLDASGQPVPGAVIRVIGDEPKLSRGDSEEDEAPAPSAAPAVA